MKAIALFLILTFAVAGLGAQPTGDEIDALYAENPSAVHEMVRKLWTLEHADPDINIPAVTVLELEDRVLVEYPEPGSIEIGEEPYTLEYSFRLRPEAVDFAVERDPGMPLWVPIASAGVGLAAGVSLGLYIALR